MELLGKSLESCFNQCNRKFSVKTVSMLGYQMVYKMIDVYMIDIENRVYAQ